jgi:3-isopropylmalate/(R)-2-methylmalate dehydratase small subunit/methanogen homoaconitase small subunit
MLETPTIPIPSSVESSTWVFGDNLNTDVLHPPAYYSLDAEVVKKGLFQGIDTSLQERVQPGDLIVGGRNFGCGSSRETSIRSLKLNGIAAIIAIDFARIFFRSATNQGIPCLCLAHPGDITLFSHGFRARLDFQAFCVQLADGTRVELQNPGEFVRNIWSAGGLLGLLP